jgi:NAD+ synthase (glutamine-hydrolysing)
VLSDLYKTRVFDVAREINRRAGKALIPESTLEKPPSAELRPGQLDQDSLPPYELLDELLRRYVEGHETCESLYGDFEPAVVDKVIGMIRRNEYKRYQFAPGLKISYKAFGPGRRLPLACKPWR